MWMRVTILGAIFAGFLACDFASPAIAQTDLALQSAIMVAKDRLSFDPLTVEVGSRAAVTDGQTGVLVKILGRREGLCEFEYVVDGYGGVFTHYLCQVPLDAGSVAVELMNGDARTSFPLDRAKLIRRNGAVVEVLVGQTGEYVSYHHGERRSEMEARPGDNVKFRLRFYDSPEFARSLPNAAVDQVVEYVAGSPTAWPWMEVATERMTVGDRRRAHVPMRIAEGLAKWLPDPEGMKVVHVELSFVGVVRRAATAAEPRAAVVPEPDRSPRKTESVEPGTPADPATVLRQRRELGRKELAVLIDFLKMNGVELRRDPGSEMGDAAGAIHFWFTIGPDHKKRHLVGLNYLPPLLSEQAQQLYRELYSLPCEIHGEWALFAVGSPMSNTHPDFEADFRKVSDALRQFAAWRAMPTR